MDNAFIAVQESNPAEFSGIADFKTFGTVVAAGFSYEPLTGRDITYDEDQAIIFKPSETE